LIYFKLKSFPQVSETFIVSNLVYAKQKGISIKIFANRYLGVDHSFAQTRANKKLTMSVPSRFFNQGSFYLDIQISDGRKLHFRAEDVIAFTVIQEESKLGQWMGKSPGPLKPVFDWINS